MTAVALSNKDISRALQGAGVPFQIISFPELARFRSVDDLLARGAVVLFLELPGHVGHWQAVFRAPSGEVEVFGPYGLTPREALGTLDTATRARLHESAPLLERLLAGERVVINQVDLEAWRPDVQTCGRWVVLRLVHQDMTDAEFLAWLRAQRRPGETADDLVVRLTRPLLGK